MKTFKLFLLIVAFLVSGCGGVTPTMDNGSGDGSDGGDEQNVCNFIVEEFLNGSDVNDIESEWDCIQDGTPYVFAAFEDGTGLSSLSGPLTWQETACSTVAYQTGFGTGVLTNLAGSIVSGIATFTDTFEGTSFDVSCVLDETPNASNP